MVKNLDGEIISAIKKVDDQGRVVIPKKWKDQHLKNQLRSIRFKGWRNHHKRV